MEIMQRLNAELPAGYEWTAKDVALMHLAQSTADTIKRLEAELEAQGVAGNGSRNQTRVNPLVAEIRLQRESLAKLLGRIVMPGDEPAKSEQHQRAAQARWERVARNA